MVKRNLVERDYSDSLESALAQDVAPAVHGGVILLGEVNKSKEVN